MDNQIIVVEAQVSTRGQDAHVFTRPEELAEEQTLLKQISALERKLKKIREMRVRVEVVEEAPEGASHGYHDRYPNRHLEPDNGLNDNRRYFIVPLRAITNRASCLIKAKAQSARRRLKS